MFNFPNLLTLFNIFCGCCAIVSIKNGYYVDAVGWLIASGIADFLDGLAARALKISGPLGKELDSLADMVSFGVAPGVIFHELLVLNFPDAPVYGLNIYAAPAFILTCFACLRLAKFNLDTRQSDSFMGLNTPAMTIFTVGILLVFHWNSFGVGVNIIQPTILFSLIAVLCYLLIAEIPMFAFKVKNLGWKGNELRFSFLGFAILQFILFREAGLCTSVITYILFSLFENRKKKRIVESNSTSH